MKRMLAFFTAYLFSAAALFAEARTLDTIFPGLDGIIKESLSAKKIYHNMNAKEGFRIQSAADAGIPPAEFESGKFKYIIETLIFIPEAKNKTITDVYNALKDLNSLQGRTYYSSTRKKNIALFSEVSRIVSDKNFRPMRDARPYADVPEHEVRFLRLQDINFGNCYYRADVKKYGYGIQFSLTNFKTIDFIFIPVIKTSGFLINYYIEPLRDGVLFYGFIAIRAVSYIDSFVNVPQAIVKRIAVINKWVIDGLR